MASRKAVQPPNVKGQCKDCPEGVSRVVRRPGPRCAEHTRAFRVKTKAAKHGRWIRDTYGITPEAYEDMYEAQGRVCALCRRANGRTRKLSVDHDHGCCPGKVSCGQCVRSLICGPCNEMLGHGRDDPEFFLRTSRYLIDPPGREVLQGELFD